MWDLLLAALAYRTARRPTRGRVGTVLLAGALDAAFSINHVTTVGLGDDVVTTVLRAASALGPTAGTLLLLHALRRCGR